MPTATETQDFTELFSNLEITPSEEPLPAITRPSRSSVPNPFGDSLKMSLEHSTPYTIYVPVAAVQRAIQLINSAARTLNVGVRVVPNLKRNEKGQVEKDSNGKVIYLAETKGDNKGKVMVRYQANPNRKQASRFAVVKDSNNKELFAVKDRQTGSQVIGGLTKEAAREQAKRRNTVAAEGSSAA